MNFTPVIILIISLYTAVLGKSVRIIGGIHSNVSEFPYVVSFRNPETTFHFCGGSIISHQHILTASHCLIKYKIEDIKIYTGMAEDVESPQEIFGIHSFTTHTQFTGDYTKKSMLQHDIAVVTTDKCIEFNEFQNKVKLPTRDIAPDKVAILNGWGATHFHVRKYSRTLKKDYYKIIGIAKCQELFEFKIHEEQLCAYAGEGKGACMGDSGSGLVHHGEIVGIASFVIPCATGVPDIYTRVYSYVDFIKSTIADSRINSKCSIL